MLIYIVTWSHHFATSLMFKNPIAKKITRSCICKFQMFYNLMYNLCIITKSSRLMDKQSMLTVIEAVERMIAYILYTQFHTSTIYSPAFISFIFLASRKKESQSWRLGNIDLASTALIFSTSGYPLNFIVLPVSETHYNLSNFFWEFD